MLDHNDFFEFGNDSVQSSSILTKVRISKWKGELLLNKIAERFSINFKLLKEEELTKINAEMKETEAEMEKYLDMPNHEFIQAFQNLREKKMTLVKKVEQEGVSFNKFFCYGKAGLEPEEANVILVELFIERKLLEAQEQLNNGDLETLKKSLNDLKEIKEWRKINENLEASLETSKKIALSHLGVSRKNYLSETKDYIKKLEIKITSLQHQGNNQGNLLNTIINANTWESLEAAYNNIVNEEIFKDDSTFAKSVEREKINVLKKLINGTNNLSELETLKINYSNKILTEYQNEVNTAYQEKKQQLTEDQGDSFLMAISQSQDWKTLKSAIKNAQDNLTSSDDQTKIKVRFISVLEKIINSTNDKNKLETLKTNYQSDSYFQALASSDQTKINNAYDARKQQLETSIPGNNNQGQDNNSNIMPWVIGISMSFLGICLVTVLYRFYRKRKIQK